MPLNSPKQKGSKGEYEIIGLLTSWAAEVQVTLELERNLEQVRKGGSDVNGVPGLEIEVKRVEANGINQWWKQVCAASAKSGNRPLLCHRANRKPWQFRTYVFAAEWNSSLESVTAPLIVDMSAAQAKVWFQLYIQQKVDYV